jgi:hypothetical protein
MAEAARILMLFVVLAGFLLVFSSTLLWWFEAPKRHNRSLSRVLGKPADAVVMDRSGQKSVGLNYHTGDVVILWATGQQGLLFAYDEIEGAELIVDERIVARAQKGEARRVLNEYYPQAQRVILRFIFNDLGTPEFELELFGSATHLKEAPQSATEAVRLGQKWLSHIDAVIKRQPATPSPYAYRQPERNDQHESLDVWESEPKPEARNMIYGV